jgi:regulator of sigma E protease
MTVLIFIAVLVVLIVVHEIGHFVAAKLSGMRVDEFGIGYPPRIWGKKIGETEYTLNALPFGGFVRIYGEDETNPDVLGSRHAFSARPKLAQAITLVAGVAMNLLLAYILISITLAMGTPRALSDEELTRATDVHVVVAQALPGGPADVAGLIPGDRVLSIVDADGGEAYTPFTTDDFIRYVSESDGALQFTIERNGEQKVVEATPQAGVLTSDPSRLALGVAVAPVGTVPVSWWRAPIDGAVYTWEITKQTTVGLLNFFGQVFTLSADLRQVSGPVGIAGAVGNAYAEGAAALFSIAAIISINLAIINLLPIPALDGGRLLFVIIEAIIRRPIKPAVAAAVNGLGFAFLILLMVVVTCTSSSSSTGAIRSARTRSTSMH